MNRPDLVDAWLAGDQRVLPALRTALADPAHADHLVRELHFRHALRRAVQARDERRSAAVQSGRLSARRGPRPRRTPWPWAAVAAAALLLIGIGLLSAPSARTSTPVQAQQVDPEDGAVLAEVLSGPSTGLVRGTAVRVGDQLHAAGTPLVLRLNDGVTTLTLSDGQLMSEASAWRLTAGACAVQAGPQPPDRPLRLRTPHATTEVVGTRFVLRVADGATTLAVEEGVVRFTPRHGGSELVRTGERAATSGAVPLPAALAWHFPGATAWPLADTGAAGEHLTLNGSGNLEFTADGLELSPGSHVSSVGRGDAAATARQIAASGAATLEVVLRFRAPARGKLLLAEVMGFAAAGRPADGQHPLQLWCSPGDPQADRRMHWALVARDGRFHTWVDGRRLENRPGDWDLRTWHPPLHVKLGLPEQAEARIVIEDLRLTPGALDDADVRARAFRVGVP